MIEITLNGATRTVSDGQSVARLLEELELTKKRVAVELNGDILPRSKHGETALKTGDRVEIVHAIGGG